MSEDNTTEENKNVYEFTRRGGTTPPTVTPTWSVIYSDIKGEERSELVTGYIYSLMPFFIVSAKATGTEPNDAVLILPAERLSNVTRAKD